MNLKLPTDEHLVAGDSRLRAEADDLLNKRGLRAILEQQAPIHVVGSYALKLMAWRDLDISLDAADVSLEEFFDFGKPMTLAFSPWKMSFINTRDHETARYPRGLYWGIRLGDIHKGAWKIDVWAFESADLQQKLHESQLLMQRLNEDNRIIILRLKSQLWRDPRYRDEITSQDIYQAVLDGNARSIADFWAYVQRRRQ